MQTTHALILCKYVVDALYLDVPDAGDVDCGGGGGGGGGRQGGSGGGGCDGSAGLVDVDDLAVGGAQGQHLGRLRLRLLLLNDDLLPVRGHHDLPGDGIKRDPERENLAVLTIAAQTANSIHIRVTFNAVTR